MCGARTGGNLLQERATSDESCKRSASKLVGEIEQTLPETRLLRRSTRVARAGGLGRFVAVQALYGEPRWSVRFGASPDSGNGFGAVKAGVAGQSRPKHAEWVVGRPIDAHYVASAS